MELKEVLQKWEKELARLKDAIREAARNENRGMIDFLYPKMQQVHDFVEDLKKCVG